MMLSRLYEYTWFIIDWFLIINRIIDNSQIVLVVMSAMLYDMDDNERWTFQESYLFAYFKDKDVVVVNS
jgi:hypothetical protein